MSVLPSSVPESQPEEKEFTALDRVFGNFLCRKAGEENEALCALGMELISARREGHSFIYLSPEKRQLLEKHPCLTDEKQGVLRLEENKLYLFREFLNERIVAEAVAKRLLTDAPPADFTDEKIDAVCCTKLCDEQHRAVRTALSHAFALISGGPGTGKSTIITAVAELELERNPQSRIRIAAPTGKAAQLLADSLREKLPQRGLEARTLHKLFGIDVETGKFKHNRENPLECDLLIVDECSMVSLSLAANIFRGLRPGTRVVLVGDHRQLESIESGAVLAELLSREAPPLLAEAATELIKNHRSDRAPKIQKLAAKIREEVMSPEEICQLLASEKTDDCCFFPAVSDELMLETARKHWAGLRKLAADPANKTEAFKRLNGFRILTANRIGPGGCNEINARIMRTLGLRSRYAPGSALMVTRNSEATGLANGDIGLVFAAEGESRVFFEHCDRSFSPGQLPPHESAFATTVHKAQGSGFDEVFFALPQAESPLLSRELFYTALTRAKLKITIAGPCESVVNALKRRCSRNSCLAERITRFLENEKNGL